MAEASTDVLSGKAMLTSVALLLPQDRYPVFLGAR